MKGQPRVPPLPFHYVRLRLPFRMDLRRHLLAWAPLRSLVRLSRPMRGRCRVATLADAPAVGELMRPLFPAAARSEVLPAAERLLSETARGGGAYQILEEEGRIVAGCQVGPLLQSAGLDGCWILGLWTHPAHRGRGAGERLIREVLRAAAERGETRLYCHIAGDNQPSLALFRKVGFQPAPPELTARVEERFHGAFTQGCEVKVFEYALPLHSGPR